MLMPVKQNKHAYASQTNSVHPHFLLLLTNSIHPSFPLLRLRLLIIILIIIIDNNEGKPWLLRSTWNTQQRSPTL
jgi:hypothetical protein